MNLNVCVRKVWGLAIMQKEKEKGSEKQKRVRPYKRCVSNAILSQPQHEEYIGLGTSADHRQKVYQGLFDDKFEVDVIDFFKQSLQSGTPLGNDKFKSQIETAVGRKVGWLDQVA